MNNETKNLIQLFLNPNTRELSRELIKAYDTNFINILVEACINNSYPYLYSSKYANTFVGYRINTYIYRADFLHITYYFNNINNSNHIRVKINADGTAEYNTRRLIALDGSKEWYNATYEEVIIIIKRFYKDNLIKWLNNENIILK